MEVTEKRATFERFMDSVKGRALAYALHLARNKEDAEDLVQEASLRAFRAFDPDSHVAVPDAWMKQIVRRCFLDMKRRRRRRPTTTSLEAIQDENPYFDAADPKEQTDVLAINDAFSPQVRKALQTLTEEQRAIVIAALTEGETHAALSERFGCGVTTFRTRLHRAHRCLKRNLMTVDPSFRRQNDHSYA